MLVYKITDEYGETRGNTVWGEGVSHEAPGEGELCGAGWIHCYIDPLIAAFMYRIHVPFMNPILWEAEAEPPFKYEGQLKMGCRKLTTIRKIPMPFIDIEQRVEIAIRCALSTESSTDAFTTWANNWLAGIDRSKESTRAIIGASEYLKDARWPSRGFKRCGIGDCKSCGIEGCDRGGGSVASAGKCSSMAGGLGGGRNGNRCRFSGGMGSSRKRRRT